MGNHIICFGVVKLFIACHPVRHMNEFIIHYVQEQLEVLTLEINCGVISKSASPPPLCGFVLEVI